MYICLCRGIAESDVCRLGRAGVVSAEALADNLGIDSDECCGRCLKNMADLAALAQGEWIRAAPRAPAGTSAPS